MSEQFEPIERHKKIFSHHTNQESTGSLNSPKTMDRTKYSKNETPSPRNLKYSASEARFKSAEKSSNFFYSNEGHSQIDNSNTKGVGFKDNISSSTLRHTSSNFSFAKANRFPDIPSSQIPSDQFFELPTTQTQLSAGIGFDQKQPIFPFYTERNAREKPSPDAYFHSPDEVKPFQASQGFSFGIPYQFYEQTYIPGNQLISPSVAQLLPATGQYNISGEPGKTQLQYSLYGQGKMFNQLDQRDFPPPNFYNPKQELIVNTRFKDTSQGQGRRPDFTYQRVRSPGPAAYNLKSVFDQFKPLDILNSDHKVQKLKLIKHSSSQSMNFTKMNFLQNSENHELETHKFNRNKSPQVQLSN